MSNEIKPLSFSLFDIERSIAQRDYKTFEEYLTKLLSFIDNRAEIESTLHVNENGQTTCSHRGLVPFTNQLSFNEKVDLYSRLAAAITTYLSDSEYVPNDEFLIRFIVYKTHITNIFYLSCYGNTDHIMFNRGLSDKNNSLNLKTDQDIKFLYVCLSLNSNIEFDVEMLVNAIPLWGMYWYLGLLYGHHHSYNLRIGSNLNKVIDAHHLIQNMVFDDSAVELSAAPWMLCSYLDRSDRHEIKKSINIAMQKWIEHKQLSPGIKKRISRYTGNTTSIKRIVVLSEKYTSIHAMYRSYHKPIRELRDHYDVTLFSTNTDYDETSSKDFDRIIEIKDTASDIEYIITEIAKIKPDLILYPSIGMAKWTIPLCNLRLAKYQMMCYGHPSSAFSNCIDFGATSGFPKGPNYQKFMMEKFIVTGPNTYMARPPGYKAPAKKSVNDGVVRIAINSSLPKITQRFINLCILLKQHSALPIEFHFFLIQSNAAFEKSLRERIGAQVIIHPPKPYNEYMETLSQCDLALGTFPFGGSNTNIDLALLAIPKIFYTEGCDLASYTDIGIHEKLEVPDILHPSTEAAFLANAIYLIHDSVERNRISELIKAKDLDEVFFKENVDHQDHMLIDAIKNFVEHKPLDY